MKIAFYGNTCNNFFAMARAMRRVSDIDAHLFLDADAPYDQLPECESPELRDAYPDWIHKGPYQTLGARFWPRTSPLVAELKRFDLVMVSGGGVRFAPYVDRPFIFYVTGWDLTVAPFPVRFIQRPRGVAPKVAALLGGYWQRRGIKAVDQLWSQPFSPFRVAAERLGIERGRIIPKYFPIMIDTDVYRYDPAARTSQDANVRRLVDGHDFVVFHPSRMMLNRAPRFVDTGQWKGNDRLIEGFARFAATNPASKPVLALIDHGHSPDVEKAKRLIRRLGIERSVVWLRSENYPRGFDRADLLPFYSVADVVADEFGIGWFGSVVVEGLSMGKPVLCYLDAQVMSQLYPRHPILTPKEPEEIASTLSDLWRNPEERRRRGDLGREWAVEFHSLERAGARYLEQIEEIVRDFAKETAA